MSNASDPTPIDPAIAGLDFTFEPRPVDMIEDCSGGAECALAQPATQVKVIVDLLSTQSDITLLILNRLAAHGFRDEAHTAYSAYLEFHNTLVGLAHRLSAL